MFNALLLTKDTEGATVANLASLADKRFPQGDVLIDAAYFAVNDKDAQALTAKSPIVCDLAMVPGIDLAGTLKESLDARRVMAIGTAGDTAMPCVRALRERELPAAPIERNTQAIPRQDIAALAPRLLGGQARGRVRVAVTA